MGDGRVSIRPPPMQEIALPTPAERSILLKMVEQSYPELSARQQIAGDVAKLALGAANFDRHFLAGLMFLSYVKRSDRLDMERSPWWWLESCRHWLRQHAPEMSSLITPPPFLAACVASGVQARTARPSHGVLRAGFDRAQLPAGADLHVARDFECRQTSAGC